MAINGLGTQPTFDSSEYEVPASPPSDAAAPAPEQQKPGIPEGPSAQLELSEAGQQKSSEMYRAGEGPAHLEAAILKHRAQQKAASKKMSGGKPPHEHGRMAQEHGPRMRTRPADLPAQNETRVPIKNRVGEQLNSDPKHSLLERAATQNGGTAAVVYGNQTGYNPKVQEQLKEMRLKAGIRHELPKQASLAGGPKAYGNRTGYNPKVQAYTAAGSKFPAGDTKADTQFPSGYMKADTQIPEALTEQDVDDLLAYRRDQLQAALLKANEGQPDSRNILASSSAGVKKAYHEIPDALTNQDLENLIQYRKEQLDATVARKNEMAQARRMQEASEMPDGLSEEEANNLWQTRKDQYEAAYLKANEDQLNVEDALASRSEGVRQAYNDLSDALTKEDISYLLEYSQKQYDTAKQYALKMMPDTFASGTDQEDNSLEELIRTFAAFEK